jgi:hypothetical protein
MFKIDNPEIRKKAVEFLSNVSLGTVNAYGKWITAVKAVADACTVSGHVLRSQSCATF